MNHKKELLRGHGYSNVSEEGFKFIGVIPGLGLWVSGSSPNRVMPFSLFDVPSFMHWIRYVGKYIP